MELITMRKYLTEILYSNPPLGGILWDIFYSAKDERWSVALVSLFVIVEQTLRWAIDTDNKPNLYSIINDAHSQGLITNDEKDILHEMRNHRRMYLHANFFATAYLPDGLEGKASLVSEKNTAKMIYETLSEPIFKIIAKLLRPESPTLFSSEAPL